MYSEEEGNAENGEDLQTKAGFQQSQLCIAKQKAYKEEVTQKKSNFWYEQFDSEKDPRKL